jgi:hypothetical protein
MVTLANIHGRTIMTHAKEIGLGGSVEEKVFREYKIEQVCLSLEDM